MGIEAIDVRADVRSLRGVSSGVQRRAVVPPFDVWSILPALPACPGREDLTGMPGSPLQRGQRVRSASVEIYVDYDVLDKALSLSHHVMDTDPRQHA